MHKNKIVPKNKLNETNTDTHFIFLNIHTQAKFINVNTEEFNCIES